MALASLPDPQHWLEEGIATYVEPIARSQAGQLRPERVWADMLGGMGHGEPEAFDRGLDRTHTWGRTYWGGALFCLVADVEIRRQTNNTYGLQDALRAIVGAGGTIDKNWPLTRVLRVGTRQLIPRCSRIFIVMERNSGSCRSSSPLETAGFIKRSQSSSTRGAALADTHGSLRRELD